MQIQAVSDSQAWGEFLAAAHKARARNDGFSISLSNAQQSLSSKPKVTLTNVAPSHTIQTSYRPAAAEQDRPVLGARFDAYA